MKELELCDTEKMNVENKTKMDISLIHLDGYPKIDTRWALIVIKRLNNSFRRGHEEVITGI